MNLTLVHLPEIRRQSSTFKLVWSRYQVHPDWESLAADHPTQDAVAVDEVVLQRGGDVAQQQHS